jgi:AcrR family transcriptional regulator
MCPGLGGKVQWTMDRKSTKRLVERLDSAAWIESALHVLAERGVDGIRVEVLAKQLNVTKGSFYWHFKDRAALLDAMLQEWRRRATLEVIEKLESTHEPALKRLHRLLRLQFDARRAEFGADIELSVRLWGRHDHHPARVLHEIDELRLRYISKLLEELGIDKSESRARAILIYSYMRVSRSLADPSTDRATIQICENLLAGKPGTILR